MTEGPLAEYRSRLAAGSLKHDEAQAMAVEKLQSLHHAVANYRPASGQSGWRARFGFAFRRDEVDPPQGLYIYGEVGRGKSMLMDMFFASTTVQAKKRVHFHEFMRDIHAEIHRWRQTRNGEADPIPRLARDIAASAWLLCLDELQVHDIADAMILGRLFEALLEAGVVIVATSNRAPDDLYKDGLQRERFLPFIALLKQRLDLLALDSEQDYRLGRKRGMRVFHTPLGPEATGQLDACFTRLTDGHPPHADKVTVHGREIPVPATSDGVARFSFEELCARPLGPSDYLAIATHYHTLVIDGIPSLGPENRNEAKRFVTLIDALYEHKVTLICSAAAAPQSLYPTGEGAFEFQRTVSRLMEMQAEDYLARRHLT